MTTHETKQAVVTELRSVIQQFERLPALQKSLRQDKKNATATLRRVLANYAKADDRPKRFFAAMQSPLQKALSYLDAYPTTDDAPHSTPTKKGRKKAYPLWTAH